MSGRENRSDLLHKLVRGQLLYLTKDWKGDNVYYIRNIRTKVLLEHILLSFSLPFLFVTLFLEHIYKNVLSKDLYLNGSVSFTIYT